MAIKLFKEGYMIEVDPPLSEELSLSNASFCVFGFDVNQAGEDICWVKDLVTDKHIYKANVDEMADSAGTLVGDKAAVKAYLLAFVGSGDDTASPTV